tara:strand:- start:464 stop:601 length:138 start_codon:yes stop_codon:yes gene_type:complete
MHVQKEICAVLNTKSQQGDSREKQVKHQKSQHLDDHPAQEKLLTD